MAAVGVHFILIFIRWHVNTMFSAHFYLDVCIRINICLVTRRTRIILLKRAFINWSSYICVLRRKNVFLNLRTATGSTIKPLKCFVTRVRSIDYRYQRPRMLEAWNNIISCICTWLFSYNYHHCIDKCIINLKKIATIFVWEPHITTKMRVRCYLAF